MRSFICPILNKIRLLGAEAVEEDGVAARNRSARGHRCDSYQNVRWGLGEGRRLRTAGSARLREVGVVAAHEPVPSRLSRGPVRRGEPSEGAAQLRPRAHRRCACPRAGRKAPPGAQGGAETVQALSYAFGL